MRAAGSPLADRFASTASWLVVSAIVASAAGALALAPGSGGRMQPGDVVSYSEDKVGRPWRVVREHEFGRYVVRNGTVYAIAEVDDLAPYSGPSRDLTVQMTGELWREKVQEIRRRSSPPRARAF